MISEQWPREGEYVDFKDRDNFWQVGLVILKNQNIVKIRCEGYPSKFDEIILISNLVAAIRNQKILPFRTLLRGHVGQRKTSASRDHFKFTSENINERIKRLEDFIANSRLKSAYELVQFLRGQHYFYLDFLMTNKYHQMLDLIKVYQYFYLHLTICRKYLQYLQGVGLPYWFEEISDPNAEEEEINWTKSYRQSYYEIFDGAYLIAGLYERYFYFTKSNENFIKQIVGEVETHENYISNNIVKLNLLSEIKAFINNIYSELSEKPRKLPLPFVFGLFKLFAIIQKAMHLEDDPEIGLLLERIFLIISRSFSYMSNEDILHPQFEQQYEFFISQMRNYYTKNGKITVVEHWIEESRFNYCVLLIRSDKLQRKIRGIFKLKQYSDIIYKQIPENSFKKAKYIQYFNQCQIMKVLFEDNQHVEIFKKSLELVFILYKYNFLGVQYMAQVWQKSIHKHAMIVKNLYHSWTDISQHIVTDDLPQFVEISTTQFRADNALNLNNEHLEFYYSFLIEIIHCYSVIKSRLQSGLQRIEEIIHNLIIQAYKMLLLSQRRETAHRLTVMYSKIISIYPNSSYFISQLFNSLTNQQFSQISLGILNQLYLRNDQKRIFIPNDFMRTFITYLQTPQITVQETNLIIKLITKIFIMSSKQNQRPPFKRQDFKQIWLIFRRLPIEHRSLFYEWILCTEKTDYIYSYNKINNLFKDIREYIFQDILSSPDMIDYAHLSKKQMEIILQFFINKNLNANKLEEKKYQTNFKIIYRLRTIELINETLLWTIFQQCKSQEVIPLLNKNIISFYFFYNCSLVSYPLRKGRIDDLMTRINSNLKNGLQNKNYRLLKHTLSLLRNIIELIKEEKRYESEENHNLTRIKIQIFHNNKVNQFQVNYEDTMGTIKLKIADFYKLNPLNFKLFNNKNQQFTYDVKDIPVSCMTEKYFKIAQIAPETETLTKFIFTFLDEEIQYTLIKMLQNQTVAIEVFNVLDQIQLKSEKKLILKTINTILEKYNEDDLNRCRFIALYHTLEIKIYEKLIDQVDFMQQYIQNKCFQKLINQMTHSIRSINQFSLLIKLTHLLFKIIKRRHAFPTHFQIPKKCIHLMNQICNYLMAVKIENIGTKESIIRLYHTCNNIVEEILGEKQMLSFYAQQAFFESLIENIYLRSQFEEIRQIMSEKLKKYLVCTEFTGEIGYKTERLMAELFVNKLYYKILPFFYSKNYLIINKGISELYNVLGILLKKLSSNSFEQFVLNAGHNNKYSFYEDIMDFLIKLKEQREVLDFNSSYILQGHLNVLRSIHQINSGLINSNIINFVLEDCLTLTEKLQNRALCQNYQTIKAAFQLLESMLKGNTTSEYLQNIIWHLYPIHKIQYWRTTHNWSLNQKIELKPHCKYRGLANPGCVCYMNSLVQQLYLIDEFRLAMLELDLNNSMLCLQQKSMSQEGSNTENAEDRMPQELFIMQALKQLFLRLMYSEENNISPINFARTFKTADKKPLLRINQQMDIDQFSSMLFDKIEKGLSSISHRNFVKDLFGGIYMHEVISKQCSHRSSREEEFISISLEVKANIIQSFKSLVKIQTLDGENKYYCEQCDRKVKAEKMQSIKKLPPYLILCLKRFEFNYEIQAKIKINDFCQFYPQLNLKAFSSQQIRKNTDTSEILQQEGNSDEYFIYKLRGVVIHTGSADSGHYYSFIETKDSQWFEFNDEEVYPFDFSKLPDEAFGAKQFTQQFKIRNAYLLIYQKQYVKKESLVNRQIQILNRRDNSNYHEMISRRNREIHLYQLLFSQKYEELVQQVAVNFQLIKELSYSKQLEQNFYEYYLSFYFLIKIRKQSVQEFIQFSKFIEQIVLKQNQITVIYLTLFTSCNFIEEFFIYNSIRQKCRVIANIFYQSLVKYTELTKNNHYTNELLSRVFQTLKIMFANYSPIQELTTSLRKYIEYLIETNNRPLLYYIITKYTFEEIYFEQLLGCNLDKAHQQQFRQLLHEHKQKNSISFLAPIELEGKRCSNLTVSEDWRIVALILQINKEIARLSFNQGHDNSKANQQYHQINLTFYRQQADNIAVGKMANLICQSTSLKGTFYLFSVFKEMDILCKLLDGIQKGLKDFQSSRYRPFMMLIVHLLEDPDKKQSNIERLIIILQKAFKHNEKYFLQTDLINQWIIKYCEISEQFQEVLENKKQFLDHIINWVRRTPTPTLETLKKHKFPTNQRLTNKYYGIVVSADPKDYQANFARLQKDFQNIRSSKYFVKRKSFVNHGKITVGAIIEYYDIFNTSTSKWKRGKVLENNFGQLTIKKDCKQETRIIFWEDSQKIRLPLDEQLFQSEQGDPSYEESEDSERDHSSR